MLNRKIGRSNNNKIQKGQALANKIKDIACAKVPAWYAAAVALAACCMASIFTRRAVVEGTSDAVHLVIKATILSASAATALLLWVFAFAAMRNKKNPLPYFAAMLSVGAIIFIVKFFYVI